MGPACGRHGGAGGLWKACDRLAMAPWVHVRAGARPAGKPATSQEEAGEPGEPGGTGHRGLWWALASLSVGTVSHVGRQTHPHTAAEPFTARVPGSRTAP